MQAAVVASPEPNCATHAPIANSDPPTVKAIATTQLIRCRRTATVGVGRSTPRIPRLRAVRDSQVTLRPSGASQVSRLVNGPPPAVLWSVQSGRAWITRRTSSGKRPARYTLAPARTRPSPMAQAPDYLEQLPRAKAAWVFADRMHF